MQMSGRQILDSMKAPCMSKEQLQITWRTCSQGLQCIIGRFQTQSAIWQFSNVHERINTAKQKDGFTPFLMLSVLEANIFQCGFLEEHKVCINNHYRSSM